MPQRWKQPLLPHIHKNYVHLHEDEVISDVLQRLRRDGVKHKILYFYVVDTDERLIGVLPVRHILTAPEHSRVGEFVVRSVVSLSEKSSLGDARKMLSEKKFLALPVLDEQNRIMGVIDIEFFAGDLGNVGHRSTFDDVYVLLGILDESGKTPWERFLSRAPWLFVTLAAGVLAAFMSGIFEKTLQEMVVLAFFLTVVLGLNESICMQSASIATHGLNTRQATWKNAITSAGTEIKTVLWLGAVFGTIVGLVAWFWKEDAIAALSITFGLMGSITMAGFWGGLVPYWLKRVGGDANLAAAPVALGLTDLTTILIYFSTASFFAEL